MGTGIAMTMLNVGIPVVLIEQNQKASVQKCYVLVDYSYVGTYLLTEQRLSTGCRPVPHCP